MLDRLDRLLLSLALLGSALLVWFYPGPFGADAHAVYLPIARALNEGAGWVGFAPLVQGSLRLPGHSALLAGAAWLTGDLRAGVALLNTLAMGAIAGFVYSGVRRAGAASPWPGAAAGLAVLQPNLVEAGGKALPDAVGVGLVLLCGALLLAERRTSGWRAAAFVVLAGLVAAFATQVRLNLIVLIPCGLVFLLAQRRSGRWLRTPLFLLVCGLPFLLLVPLARALAEIEIVFPHGSFERGITAGHRELSGPPGLPQMISATLQGFVSIPERLFATVDAPWVVLGAFSLAVGLYRRWRDPVRLLALLLFSSMVLALVPIHFEARYYTFAGPFLVGAAVVGLDAFLRGPWSRSLAPLAWGLVLTVVAHDVASARRQVTERRATELAARALCLHIDRTRGEDPAIFVATTDRMRLYSRFNDCETSVRAPQRTFLVSEHLVLHPLPFRLPEGAKPVLNRALVREEELRFGPWRMERIVPEYPSPKLVAEASTPGPKVFSLEWARELPWSPPKACRSEWMQVPPGPHRLVVEIHSRGNVAGRLGIVLGTTKLALYGAHGTRHERMVEVPPHGRIALRFCPVTAYKSGRIDLRLSLHQRPELPAPAPY